MGILNKIFTAIRGGAREVGESVVDANSIRIFEQEIHDAENNLRKAKGSLTEVMAKETQTKRKISSVKESIEEHEGYALEAMNKGKEDLALEVADKIAALESDLNEHTQVLSTFTSSVERLKGQIKSAEKTIAENRRQLQMVKTTESVQKATMAVNDTVIDSGSSMRSAKESLERIRRRQQDTADKMEASQQLADEMSGNDLKQKLESEGIGGGSKGASDVLARLKAKQSAK
jgi:phage shock protein A